jgi:hypothetical protein
LLRYGLRREPLVDRQLQFAACNRPSSDVDNAHLMAKVDDVNISIRKC